MKHTANLLYHDSTTIKTTAASRAVFIHEHPINMCMLWNFTTPQILTRKREKEWSVKLGFKLGMLAPNGVYMSMCYNACINLSLVLAAFVWPEVNLARKASSKVLSSSVLGCFT